MAMDGGPPQRSGASPGSWSPRGRRNARPIVGPGDPIACDVPPDGPGGARCGTTARNAVFAEALDAAPGRPRTTLRQTWRCPAGISQPGICSADLPPDKAKAYVIRY